MDKNICKILDALYKIFDLLNEAKFDGKLETPLIVVLSDDKGRKLGHFTPAKMWEDNGVWKHEIAIMAEILNKPFAEICSVVLHEMCHYNNHIKGIKDTTANGRYHNKRFRNTAEDLGLIVEKSNSYGWGHTRPSAELEEFFNGLDVDKSVFVSHRKLVARVKPEIDLYKYQCPQCAIKFTLTKMLDLKCKICDVDLVRVRKNAYNESGV